MPSAYDYITKTGSTASVEADSPEAALAAADRAPTSGVALRMAAQAGATPPAPPASSTTEKASREKGKGKQGTLTDRYAKDKKQIASTFSIEKPNEDAMREIYRQRAQAAVDAVNTKFAAIEAQDRETVDLMNRERRASNVLAGLSGTPTGAARTIDTTKEGDAVHARTAQQKDAEVQAILTGAQTRATEEFRKERELYLSQQKDKYAAEQALATRIRDEAKKEIGALAGTMSFDDLKAKNPALLEQYLAETGMDETGLKSVFLNAAKDNLVSDTPTIVGNKAIWFTRKPDGTMGKTEVDLPASSSKTIKDSRITDAGIQVLYDDGTYEVLGGSIGDGSNGDGDDSFTKTQKNKGASNAGVTIDQFSEYDADTQNFFINGYSAFSDLIKQRDKGDITNGEIRTFVEESETLSDDAKEILLARVPEDEEEGENWLANAWEGARGLFGM